MSKGGKDREREGGEREKEREKHQFVLLFYAFIGAFIGDWESNPQPWHTGKMPQPTELQNSMKEI